MNPLESLAAVGALCALPLFAQQRLDPSRTYPITTPVRNAGTVDVTTGRWTKPHQGSKSGTVTVFNNTCTWTSLAYYAGSDWCVDLYDEGRIPSPSDPNAPAGAQAANALRSIQVSYCTFAGPLAGVGGYDMDLAFFDTLGGDCAGGAAPTPPPVSSTATAFLALAGLGLPGSTAFGFQACWLVTLDVSNAGVVLASDGDGNYDGVAADDKFLWMQRQNTTVGPLQQPNPDGFFISGEPATGGYGACSYDIPCGIDAIGGNTCGTGLDAFDGVWLNIDGIGVGASGAPVGCINAVPASYGFGTNCYNFGGYPANKLASFWLVLEADGPRAVGVSTCAQSKATTVQGCRAVLSVTDASLATGTWSAQEIPRAAGLGPGNVLGIFLYTHGVGIGLSPVSITVPFGTLCLSGFLRSSPACSPALLVGAQAGVCNPGPMTTAVNCNAGALGIAAGEDVNVQFWHRDAGAVGNANLSNAIFYTVQ